MPKVFIGSPFVSQTSTLGDNEAGHAGAKSKIVQVGGSGLTYFFPYTPVQSTFNSVGAEYSEIARPGDYSILSRKAPNLLKASFDFRVAHRPSNGQQIISKDLDVLRRMATADVPVVISGMGGYFAGFEMSGSVKFRILSLNVEIVTLSPDNQPWQANCSLELIEDRNPVFTTVTFSTITYEPQVPAKTTSSSSNGNKSSSSSSSNKPAPAPTTTNKLNYSKLKTVKKAQTTPILRLS